MRKAPVAVIGGGPAGASAALELARRGVDTIVLERSDGTGNSVGECLAPTINPLVQRMEIENALPVSGALASHGNRSSWGGTGVPMERDFLREPFGHGWHLDRPAFNAALLDAVETAGVPVLRQARVVSLERVAHGWAVGVDLPEGTCSVTAEGLVDASGRAAIIARKLSVRRRCFDSQVAVVALLDQAAGATTLHDATTIIEAAESGWWYAALLPDRRLTVTFFTDPDLLANTGVRRPRPWWRLLSSTGLTWDLVSRHEYGMPKHILTAAAGSWLLAEPAGWGWVAAGDAAAAFDPLSSHGIGSALAGGKQAAAALAFAMQGDDAAIPAYVDRVRTNYARYLCLRHAYYAGERRWPNAPFWARRHGGTREPSCQKSASKPNRPLNVMFSGRSLG